MKKGKILVVDDNHRLEGIGVQLRKDVLDLLGQLVHSE